MKAIGLIGGMSWESTVVYYQLLNRMTRDRLGGLHSARLLVWSFDFAEIEAYQAAGNWEAATHAMTEAACNLERGGADCIVICTNTMHKMAAAVQSAVEIPLIHIADATAAAIKIKGANRPLLLATRYTMEQDFYKGRLRDQHGVEICIPEDECRALVHSIIYDELCRGVISATSKKHCLDIVGQAVAQGTDGVILGCTEIGLLIGPKDLSVPVFDTTQLHAKAALDYALGG